jgi:hypothetical protein
MSGHPLHGIKPEADKIRTRCSDWSDQDRAVFLWKLQRLRPDGSKEIHPTAGTRPGTRGVDGPGSDILQWAQSFPGWTAVPG